MENILAAVIIIFIFLFGALTLSNAFLSAQEIMVNASKELEVREADVRETSIDISALRILDAGSVIELVLHNSGSVKLTNYPQWDVFADYADDTEAHVQRSERLQYEAGASLDNTWSVGNLFVSYSAQTDEVFDRGIFNPGEDMVMRLRVAPAVGVEQTARLVVSTDIGSVAATMGIRDAAPALIVNTGFKVANAGSIVITPNMLRADDSDNDVDEIRYAIVAAPAQGALSHAAEFTQAEITKGIVVYHHTGAGADSFGFLVSDGIETIGPFTAPITINEPPVLDINGGLTLPSGTTATITNALLHTTDSDDPPSSVIYTVVQFPANGALSLGSTFSQADIDGNRLTYTHAGGDADLFRFVVSDGSDVIGTYTFLIDLVS